MKTRQMIDAKSRYQAAQALKAETMAAKIRGELIPISMVEREWADICATIRAGVLSAGRRISDRLNLNPDHAEIVFQEIRTALGTLAAPKELTHDVLAGIDD